MAEYTLIGTSTYTSTGNKEHRLAVKAISHEDEKFVAEWPCRECADKSYAETDEMIDMYWRFARSGRVAGLVPILDDGTTGDFSHLTMRKIKCSLFAIGYDSNHSDCVSRVLKSRMTFGAPDTKTVEIMSKDVDM
jgi:hypothetical protein